MDPITISLPGEPRGTLTCKGCEQQTLRKAYSQKYCDACSLAADLRRKSDWQQGKGRRYYAEAKSAVMARGIEISKNVSASFLESLPDPSLSWFAKIAIPFDWAASKNHIFAMRATGHVALRREAKSYREMIALKIKAATREMPVVQNKVWLDLLIQKPNHRGDAANFIDLICDAVKVGIGVDDRWFSIRRLDWEVCKLNPQIFIGVGQESSESSQVCSSCGRILPLNAFQKNRATTTGAARNCKECCSARTRRKKT